MWDLSIDFIYFAADSRYEVHPRNTSIPTRWLCRLWWKYLSDTWVVSTALH
jgi:hypothetical protein